MDFYERAQVCIKLGAPLIKITSLTGSDSPEPIRERLARIKSAVKNEEPEKLVDFEQEMRGALENLERSYRNKETL
jgi:V/A-type H+-transporting ATPase subunit A